MKDAPVNDRNDHYSDGKNENCFQTHEKTREKIE